jgi:hypothetical protein
MSDTPKFTVVDRRKFRGDEESTEAVAVTPAAEEVAAKPAGAPRLTLVESPHAAKPEAAKPEAVGPVAVVDAAEPEDLEQAELDRPELDGPELDGPELPPAPSPEESRFQKAAYDIAAQRLDNLVRAQNPGAPAPEKIGFEHLVQQLYLSAMMQMGAGTPEGQRPRIDILGARQTIDLLAVIEDKAKGNLSDIEDRTLRTVLYELRMTFLELTRMISAQPATPPPGGAKR